MKTNSNYLKTDKLHDVSLENHNVNERETTTAKCTSSSNKFPTKISKQQAYYNKASGCSVKAQENNIFEYPSFQKNK
jgi:hypothetical protein